MRTYQQFINGKLIPTSTGRWIDVENPSTREIIAQVPDGDEQDAQQALEAAKTAQTAWSRVPAATRAGYLKQFAAVIREHREDLAHLLASEQAKVAPLAQVEVDFTADYFDSTRAGPAYTKAKSSRATGTGKTSSSSASPSAWSRASAPGTSPCSSWRARSPPPC